MKNFTKKIITICFAFNILFFQLYLFNSNDIIGQSPFDETKQLINKAKENHICNMSKINKDFSKNIFFSFGAMYFFRKIILKK